jgi:hypothetical protein
MIAGGSEAQGNVAMMAMQRRHVLGGLGAVGAGLAGSFAPLGPTTVRAATSATPLKAAATTNNGKPVVELRATSFGVRPGLTGDQSAPLLQLRNAITADRSRHYRVIFDKGAYRYSNNRWLLSSTLRLFEADRLSSEGHPSGCRRPVVHSSPIQNSSFVEM